MQNIITKIKSIYQWQFILLVIGLSLFSIYIDGRHLKSRGNRKEARISIVLGWVYLVGVVGIYFVLLFI
ncbi:MAG: hypothetical protein GX962_02315 [Epulopiscium sp.]|nr:hypothetical protein [Candidatus Epulonipiscium sp.]